MGKTLSPTVDQCDIPELPALNRWRAATVFDYRSKPQTVGHTHPLLLFALYNMECTPSSCVTSNLNMEWRRSGPCRNPDQI